MTSIIDTSKLQGTAKVVVIGDVMLDRYLLGIVDRISPEGPVPIVDVESIKNILGGAANVMSNAAGLGAIVLGFGVIGDDEEGKFVLADLIKRGVNVNNMLVDGKRRTTVKSRIMVGHHMMMRYDMEDRQEILQNFESNLIDGVEQVADEVDMLIISDYEKGVMTPSLIKSILQIANERKFEVVADPKTKNSRNYAGTTYIKINSRNAEKATGITCSSDEAAEEICLKIIDIFQCRNVILTKGKDGLTLFSEGKFTHVPAIAKDIYDVTGAGDVVTSVLAVALANGYDLKTACDISTIAAAIKVSKVGTYSLSRNELINGINLYNNNNNSL